MHFDDNKIDEFERGIKLMFISFNRAITDRTAHQKAEIVSEMLEGLPNDKIMTFFKLVCSELEALPSDSRLKAFWNLNRSKVLGGGVSSEVGKYGYYNADGVYLPHGTQEQYFDGKEWKLRPIPKGLIQKPRKYWKKSDYKRLGMDDQEIEENLRCYAE